MSPPHLPYTTSDEDEPRYPLRSLKRPISRPASDSEMDGLQSDADDDLRPTPRPPPRAPSSRSLAKKAERREIVRKRRKEKKRRLKRQRRQAEVKAAAEEAAKQDSDGASSSHSVVQENSSAPRPTISDPSCHQNGTEPMHVSDSDDDDAPLGSIIVRSSPSQAEQPNTEPTQPADVISEDEVEALAAQSLPTQVNAARSSSVPVAVEPEHDEAPSQRGASARPQDTNGSGEAGDPIQFASSDARLQLMDDAEYDDTVSDVSSVSYSDSEEYQEGEYFYTSSEGSLHNSDSEEGLGAWTNWDRQKWQGNTAHLDKAYDGNFDVKVVLRHRRNPRRGFIEYRTVWAGYPIYSTTWEPESHFNSPVTMREYWERQGGRPADVTIDLNEYSAHDSDTDNAVMRRPRQRAHEAKKRKRRDIRRDKVQLREYLASLDKDRAKAKAKEEARYEKFRRANRVELDTEPVQEKGTSRSYIKRMEKLQAKKWQRKAAGQRAEGGPPRYSKTKADRIVFDVSMKGRGGASSSIISARTRVSQLDDSIPENDEGQMVFRRSGPSSGPGYPGLGPASLAPIQNSGGVRYTTSSASGSGAGAQPPQTRPPPGSFKGAHRREPKVQLKNDFGEFLNRLHSGSGSRDRQTIDPAAGPLQTATDAVGRPITAPRRPSEARKPNLLVLQPVKDFKGGSRAPSAAPPAPARYTGSSASSEAGDNEPFNIPEMSAVRSQFNPHQPAPESEDEARKERLPQTSITLPKRSSMAQTSATENPRRRARFAAEQPKETPQALWSPPHDNGYLSPYDPTSGWDTAPNTEPAPLNVTPRLPLERDVHRRSIEGPQGKAPQRLAWHGWLEFVAGHSVIELEGALRATEAVSSDRIKALGLAVSGTSLRFDKVLPLSWLRDILAGHSIASEEAMLLEAHGTDAQQVRSSLDQVSEQVKDFDVALLAYAGEKPPSYDFASGESVPKGRLEYFAAFSGKYNIDYITGIPPALRNVANHPYTLCMMPLQLEHHPAPSQLFSMQHPPPLESSVGNIFDSSLGKKTIEDLKIGRNDIRKVKRAAQRYRISPRLYEGIRSRYNVIFLGRNPPSYEKSILYYMVRIFEGGARLSLDTDKDAKLLKDPKIGVNVFVQRAAVDEILNTDEQLTLVLAGYLRRFKRQPRCKFWTFGFSPEDPDERVREIFPGHDGLVTFSMSAILADLLRASTEEKDKEDKEEGQWTQTDNEKTAPPPVLCQAAYHVADNWRVRLHPWIRPCFRLLADQLEPACRSLKLLQEDEFPIELMLELDTKLEVLYTSALVEEWTGDVINGLPFDEPTEVPDKPEELIKKLDAEVFATIRKSQLRTISDTRFHVMVSCSGVEEKRSEEETAGVEVISIEEFSSNRCRELAKLPGN
ncbi:hypothetical protein NDA13_001995 [Ustilago tritici]|nr:hypothetical protein NDA13_001995 [Ustilago tritici]